MYVDEASKREMYAEFEQWLNEYGTNVKVGKGGDPRKTWDWDTT